MKTKRSDRRMKFLLLAVLLILVLVLAVRVEHHSRFAGPGHAVWKSEDLGWRPAPDSTVNSARGASHAMHAHAAPAPAW